MFEESKSLSERKLQVEHSGGWESNVQRSKRKTETNFKLPPRQTLLPVSFPFFLFLLFSSMRARAMEARPLPRVRSARFALAKRARSIYTMVGGLLHRERHTRPFSKEGIA